MPQPRHAIGPSTSNENFSSAIVAAGLVFVSGQGPIVAGVREPVGETIEEQTRLTLQNLQAILADAGCGLSNCVKVTVYLADLAEYDRFNAVYREFFPHPRPARTLVGAALNFGIKVEIDAIAVR